MFDELILDDKTHREILREAMTMIPPLTRDWTDFNPQDTGVMLLELCAALTEMQRFYLDHTGERHYRQYLKLLTGLETDDTAQLLAELKAQESWLYRAVTPQDYVRILTRQHTELKLDECHVEQRGLHTVVHVCRKSGRLSNEELAQIGDLLEAYRLLATQISIRQISSRILSGVCDVSLSSIYRNPALLRTQIEEYLTASIQRKEMGQRINLESIRSYLLSLPDIAEINNLGFFESGTGSGDCVFESYVYFTLKDISVILREDRGERTNAVRHRPPVL